MINFRYHVVSLVAVFLALAIGIIVGTTTISESVVKRLEGDAADFSKRNDELRKQADELEAQIEFYEKFGSTIVPGLVKGKLANRPIVIVEQEGADGEALQRIRDALKLADAARPTRVRLTAAWSLSQPGDADRLAIAINAPAEDRTKLVTSAASALGGRLAKPGDPAANDDLLKKLGDAGFVRLDDLPTGGAFPAPATLFVVVPSGAKVDRSLQPIELIPILRSLAKAKAPVAAVEQMAAADSLVDRVRAEGDLKPAVGTVDHCNTIPGQISLVAVLRGLAAGEAAKHYGVLGGASGVVPDAFA